MNEERVLLAEAVWGMAEPKQKKFIRKMNSEMNTELDKNERELGHRKAWEMSSDVIKTYTEKFKKEAIKSKLMTEPLFEALSLAYDIINE